MKIFVMVNEEGEEYDYFTSREGAEGMLAQFPNDSIREVELKGTLPKLNVMVTEFPDGVTIGWDRCSMNNGGCGQGINQCKCKGGPKELKIFEKWRTPEGGMPRYNDPDRHKTKSSKVSGTMQTAVAAAAEKVEDALDDPATLRDRIMALQDQADEELATNGKTDLFLELTDKVKTLKLQKTHEMEDA